MIRYEQRVIRLLKKRGHAYTIHVKEEIHRSRNKTLELLIGMEKKGLVNCITGPNQKFRIWYLK